MGAWGSGSFENDAALDWAGSVQSLADVRAPFDRLKVLTDASEDGGSHFLEADFSSELIAAAETVAMLLGRGIPGFPEDLAQRLADAGEPDSLLFHQARNAVSHVFRTSELAELWEEAAEDAETNEWHVAITGLVDRLNPDIEFVPWEPEKAEEHSGAPIGPCAFCDQPIEADSLFGMTIHDYTDKTSFSRALWFHLACLNARLHHKHAILDMKFDPDNMPDLDKL